MDLQTAVAHKLDELANSNHCGAGMLELHHEDRELRCRLVSTDRLACELETIQVCSPRLADLTNESMEELSSQLTDRISYLEERLRLVEKDSLAVEAQLRSAQPLVSNESRTYFELVVSRSGMLLQRYEKSSGNQRVTTPTVVTRSVLGRLCQDLLSF